MLVRTGRSFTPGGDHLHLYQEYDVSPHRVIWVQRDGLAWGPQVSRQGRLLGRKSLSLLQVIVFWVTSLSLRYASRRGTVYEEIRGTGDAPGIQTASTARQYHLSTSSPAGLPKHRWKPPILCHSLEMMVLSQ